MCFTGSNHEVIRYFALQHEPHGFGVFSCVSPITFGIEISHRDLSGFPELDHRDVGRNLARHEFKSTARRLVVEQYAA